MESRYPFVARLDADDQWLPTKIAKQFALLQNDRDLSITATGMTLVTADGKPVETHVRSGDWNGILRFFVDVGCPFPHGSVVARRDIFHLLGGYPHDPAMSHCEDYALWGVWLRFFKPAMVEEALYDYTVSDGSVSVQNREQQLNASRRVCANFAAINAADRLPEALGQLAHVLNVSLIQAGIVAYRLWRYRLMVQIPSDAVAAVRVLMPDRLVKVINQPTCSPISVDQILGKPISSSLTQTVTLWQLKALPGFQLARTTSRLMSGLWLIDRYRGLWLALLLAPLAVNTVVSLPAWDELFFLHNGVCVARSVWSLDLGAVDACLSVMAKSPIMAFLLLPAGDMQGAAARLNIAPVTLALLCFSQILVLAWLILRLRIPSVAALIAAIGAILCSPLRSNGAPYLVDGVLALVVVNVTLLMMVEWLDFDKRRRESVLDGLLWGGLLSLGVLSKLTFGFFIVLIVPAACLFSLVRSGFRLTLIKAAVTTVTCFPAGLILWKYWPLYYAHAAGASFGTLASFYDDHIARWPFIRQTIPTVMPVWFAAVLLAIWAGFGFKAQRARVLIALYAIAVVLVYFFVASGSPNKDPRFFWPIWLAPPFCFAAAVSPWRQPSELIRMATTLPVIAVMLLAIPAFGRFDLSGVDEGIAVLTTLPRNNRAFVQLATDEPYFNIEMLLLARQLNFDAYRYVNLDTVVYDVAQQNGSSIDSTPERRDLCCGAVSSFTWSSGMDELVGS